MRGFLADKPREECGVFGVCAQEKGREVVSSTYVALYALQHRGQMSCGIAVSEDGLLRGVRDSGLVPEVLDQEALDFLGQAQIAIGHVRYGSGGNRDKASAQPLVLRHVKGNIAICFNGALTNAHELRDELELGGAIFHTLTDCEVIAQVFTRERLRAPSTEKALENTMGRLKGAYSIVLMSARKLIAARDPIGFRPLCIGRVGGGYAVSSESCAFETLGGELLRDIAPGEVAVVREGELFSLKAHCGGKGALCAYELVYFARPDSVLDGVSVHAARLRAGAILAQKHPAKADVVIGAPDTGLDAALGYAQASGLPYGIGLIKNRYVGRTLAGPNSAQRQAEVEIKLGAVEHVVKGKRVVVVDDSIVRGTTIAQALRLLREAGAAEVHLRISSPPFRHPCYFGTYIDPGEALVTAGMDAEGIRRALLVDSLGYLDAADMPKIAEGARLGLCLGCFTGDYPAEPPKPFEDKYLSPLSLSGRGEDKEQ
ncbi:MAG: amidophosphoribosyltransferase [Christensenellaceae bacterium]|jgi:amidophosphoribosyltransferase|nr:amidophosphoribosyltransferase [Christensenellaceae bacterium]